MVIYKYPVKPDVSIEMPEGATILSCAVQHGQPLLWALVDPFAPKEVRHFRAVATGEPFDPAGMQYVGAFHNVEGWMVFHLFEVKEG